MTDITQRLRESAKAARALDRAALLNEAADEIVKIRHEVADMRDTHAKHTTPGECSTPREGTEPVAFAVVFDSTEQIDCELIYPDEATAGDVALDSNGSVVPLYRSPTLTDAEREALWFAVAYAQNAGHECEATLRGLLERMQ